MEASPPSSILESQVMRKIKVGFGRFILQTRAPWAVPTSAVLLLQPSLPLAGPPGALLGSFLVLLEPPPFIFPTCVSQVLLGILEVGAQWPMFRKRPWRLMEV